MDGMSRKSWIVAVLLLCIGSDQLTKFLAVKHLLAGSKLCLFSHILCFEYQENKGGFLGFLNGLPEDIRAILLTSCVAFILAIGLAVIVFSPRLTLSTLVLASMVLGGGIGNLLDRLVNEGGVIDFVSIGIGGFRTGIFNVADVSILVGSFSLGVALSRRTGG